MSFAFVPANGAAKLMLRLLKRILPPRPCHHLASPTIPAAVPSGTYSDARRAKSSSEETRCVRGVRSGSFVSTSTAT